MTDALRFNHWRGVRPEQWPLEYFSPEEVADSRDGSIVLYVPFGLVMDAIREELGSPIRVNSWYRTPEHDLSIGGKGAHTRGGAGDFETAQWNRLIFLAGKHGILGFGDGVPSFVHLDMDPVFKRQGKRPAMWGY